jgi:hypothetical protein
MSASLLIFGADEGTSHSQEVGSHALSLKGGKPGHAAIIHIAHEVVYRVGQVSGLVWAGILRAWGWTAEVRVSLRWGVANFIAGYGAVRRGKSCTSPLKRMEQTQHMAHFMYGGASPIKGALSTHAIAGYSLHQNYSR